MLIAEKMKHDWNHRARHHARFWIATEDYQTEEVFARSGEATAQALLANLQGFHKHFWRGLEIGCGIGRVLKPLAPYFKELVGVDVSSEMIAQSKIWLADHPHITTYETSGVDLQEFPHNRFDLVYSYVAFQHMPRPVFDRYLGEIHRVMTPNGYLAFQLPIGHLQDAPLEDTIGIRSYPIQEIEEILGRNGLGFLNPISSDFKSHDLSEPLSHRFHLAKKIGSTRPFPPIDWVHLEQPHFVSDLENHLYTIFADNCVRAGNYQEGIHTLQTLVKKNPDYIAGWLQLATVLIETGQLQQALSTLQNLTTLHPRYREGQTAFQNLLKKCASQRSALLTPLTTNNQTPKKDRSKDVSEYTNKDFSIR